ncbi:cytochrome b/b6 domain-containing protein [Shimia sp. SDUM112013]|uniref:cytochrome b/b6 domain-containing protein n=1 Tax=Shimia sp. SDUM112013 TaxID=3136160 RepID=UPI0032EC2F7B
MPLTNTTRQYGGLTKTFHWLTALLILTALPLGLIAENAPYADGEQLARKAMLFSLHKTVGIAAFFTAILRILWALTQTRPGLLNADNRLEAFGAHLVHWLLYGAMLMVPLTGWIHHAATTGFAPILWPLGQDLPLVPKSETLAHLTANLHFAFIIVLGLSILAHVGGAMKHFVIDRDQTLQRMLPGRNTAPDPMPETHSRAPFVTALVIWVVALTAGVVTGLGTDKPATTAQLEAVPSDWQVQEGTLSLSVVQFGSEVTGSFGNWTAAISFDETATDGRHGDVAVTVAIDSLTLGSVTDQALGADFFDVAAHPTANFAADLMAAEQGYVAKGTLTLKGMTVPVTLPFALTIKGDTATMQGQTTLNRLDFGIGTNMPDESSLGFPVEIEVTLTAMRG